MVPPVANQRILVAVAANLDVTIVDQEGEPVAAGGAVTVDIATADGTAVVTGGAASAVSGETGVYRYVLAAQANLNLLSCTWKVGGTARVTTLVEIVGGYYFSVAMARSFDPSITVALASDAKVQAVRREVEDECERITGVAWVPRYRRRRFDPGWSASLLLDDWMIRRLRSVRVYSDGTNYVAFTNAELAAVSFTDYGLATRRDGVVWNAWSAGFGGTVVEYEYGHDAPPPDLRHATLTRLRSRLMMENTGIPDRATNFVMAGGGSFLIATPGRAGFETGIPEVDAVYERYSVKTPGVA